MRFLTALVLVAAGASSAAAADSPKLALSAAGDPPFVHVYGDAKQGWTLEVKIGIVFASAESDDQLVPTLKAGKKGIKEVKCKADGDSTWYGDLTDPSKDVKINIYTCNLGEKQTSTGKHTISFGYKSAASEKTFDNVAKLEFEVKKGKQMYFAPPDPIVGPMYFNYDPEAMRGNAVKKLTPKLWMWTRVKVPQSSSTPKNIKARCELGGKQVYSEDLRADSKTEVPGEYSQFEITIWGVHHAYPGSTTDGTSLGDWAFGDHPGEYECRLSIEGETFRKWKFTVDDKGMIADTCGPALGMDAAHGVFTSNAASKDHALDAKAAAKTLYWQSSVPAACSGLL